MMSSVLITIGLFAAMIVGLELGQKLGRRYRRSARTQATDGGGSAEGVVFAVLGLLVAFTFTNAATRFDKRRELIVDQANALGTAWLRLDLLPEEDRAPIRQRMLRWLDVVIDSAHFDPESDDPGLAKAREEANRMQTEAWQLTVRAVDRLAKPQYAGVVLPPQNDWIDLSTTRLELNHMGLPPMVLATLITLTLVGSVLAGFNMSVAHRRNYVHIVAFAGVIALAIYVILDLSHPRSGLIRVDKVDEVMVNLRQSLQK